MRNAPFCARCEKLEFDLLLRAWKKRTSIDQMKLPFDKIQMD